jgi:hypothetical protein
VTQSNRGIQTCHPWDSWEWEQNPHTIPAVYELIDGKKILAWIEAQPRYSNRGHWKAVIECVTDLDQHDSWPNYYMSFERAREEVVAFLKWRLYKVRCPDQKGVRVIGLGVDEEPTNMMREENLPILRGEDS